MGLDSRPPGCEDSSDVSQTILQDQDQDQDLDESIKMTDDRDTRRKYVHGVASPRIEDG